MTNGNNNRASRHGNRPGQHPHHHGNHRRRFISADERHNEDTTNAETGSCLTLEEIRRLQATTEVDGIRFSLIKPNMSAHELQIFRTQVCLLKKNADSTQVDCERESDCSYSHCISWQRRNPSLYEYSSQMCPYLTLHRDQDTHGARRGPLRVTNLCQNGQRCRFSHTKEEQLYHPQVYKTRICKGWKRLVCMLADQGKPTEELNVTAEQLGVFRSEDYQNAQPCYRYYCPFAHGIGELRSMKQKNIPLDGYRSKNSQPRPVRRRSVIEAVEPIKPTPSDGVVPPCGLPSTSTFTNVDLPNPPARLSSVPTRALRMGSLPTPPENSDIRPLPIMAPRGTSNVLGDLGLPPSYPHLRSDNLWRNDIGSYHDSRAHEDFPGRLQVCRSRESGLPSLFPHSVPSRAVLNQSPESPSSTERFTPEATIWFNYGDFSFPATMTLSSEEGDPLRELGYESPSPVPAYRATVCFSMQIPSHQVHLLSSKPKYPVVMPPCSQCVAATPSETQTESLVTIAPLEEDGVAEDIDQMPVETETLSNQSLKCDASRRSPTTNEVPQSESDGVAFLPRPVEASFDFRRSDLEGPTARIIPAQIPLPAIHFKTFTSAIAHERGVPCVQATPFPSLPPSYPPGSAFVNHMNSTPPSLAPTLSSIHSMNYNIDHMNFLNFIPPGSFQHNSHARDAPSRHNNLSNHMRIHEVDSMPSMMQLKPINHTRSVSNHTPTLDSDLLDSRMSAMPSPNEMNMLTSQDVGSRMDIMSQGGPSIHSDVTAHMSQMVQDVNPHAADPAGVLRASRQSTDALPMTVLNGELFSSRRTSFADLSRADGIDPYGVNMRGNVEI